MTKLNAWKNEIIKKAQADEIREAKRARKKYVLKEKLKRSFTFGSVA